VRIADMPADWPFRELSREVTSGGISWHVQDGGTGPVILLLHGAGASTHTWRKILPALIERYRVIAVDLPGQGFSTLPRRARAGLDPMAADVAALLATLQVSPAAIIGHSAGAAIALRLAELLPGRPKAIVAINPALGTFEGVAGWLFPLMAKMLALNPFVPRLFARLSGHEARVRALLGSTGSVADSQMVRLYLRLVSDPAHVDGTLAMMSQWTLDGLLKRLPDIRVPVLMILGTGDKAVPNAQSERQAARMAEARVAHVAGAGHLVHEEAPEAVMRLVGAFLTESGV
jgi:magnesium chelatase accessory protein